MPLRVNLLGGLRVSPHNEGGALALPSRKARAVLAYLACPAGRAHPRDKLAALPWGDRSEGQARATLRQELYGLRRALAPVEARVLRLIDDAVAREPTSRLVAVGRPSALEAAVGPCQGELLEGLSPDAPAFAESVDQKEKRR